MESEKLEKVIIKKPLTKKEIQGFKKFYIKGKYYLTHNYLIEVEDTYKLISISDDYWSSEGWRRDMIREDEDDEFTQLSYETYNSYKHSNADTYTIKGYIETLLKKDKNAVIIGYKSPEKLKSHYHKAPTKKCKFVNPEAMF